MPFTATIPVCNPTSDYERHDYVEVDLAHEKLRVPDEVPDDSLRLYRLWNGGRHREEIPFQIDYPFGRDKSAKDPFVRGHRILTFQSRKTPPGGGDDYRKPTATFLLQGERPGRAPLAGDPALRVEHYYEVAGSKDRTSPHWEQGSPARGVKLCNGDRDAGEGLEVYFSLVPRPATDSPINYSGAATSVRHNRLCRSSDCYDLLTPFMFETEKYARWGQLTQLDFYALPWEPRFYHKENLLVKNGRERGYSLVWSRSGPCRATVTLASEPFPLAFNTDPRAYGTDPTASAAAKPNLNLTCRLYRIISFYPRRENYSEQLVVRVEECPGVSLAFRAHYHSYVDAGTYLRPRLARLEDIPDYFATWFKWGGLGRPFPLNLGYAFASDSHVRALSARASEISWRLQLGHEHRTVHCFLYEPHHGFNPLHTVGHDAWFQQLFKRLEVIPLNRYVR